MALAKQTIPRARPAAPADAEEAEFAAFEKEFAAETAHHDIVALRKLVAEFAIATGAIQRAAESIRDQLPEGTSALVFNHLAGIERLAGVMETSQKVGFDALARVEDALEEKALNAMLLGAALDHSDNVASRDALTGAYNRRYFDDRFAKMVDTARRNGSHLSVMFVDADHFKKVNDTHGHASGDEVLKDLSRIMQGGIREGRDFVARYGGEEFVIVVSGAPKTALAAAERIRAAIEARASYDTDKGIHVPSVTASMGVAHMGAKDTPESLLKRADDGVYEAKRAGRNRVVEMRVSEAAAVLRPQQQSSLKI